MGFPSPNLWITIIIVALTYVGVALGRLPPLRTNRTTFALVGVGLLLLTRQIDFKDLSSYLDIDTLVLLFAMMIINANLRLAGFFGLAGNALLRLTRNPRLFLALEIVVAGIFSALFLNDTICLMFTPLILELTLAIDRNPIPYQIALATAANIGSVATLTGNPQNMIIGVASGIKFLDFTLSLAPIAMLSLAVVWVVVIKFYPQEFAKRNNFKIQPTGVVPYYPALLIKCLIILGLLLLAFLFGAPVAVSAFIAACALLITRRIKPEKVFAEIDWGLLVLFAALFVVTGSLEANGITTVLSDITHRAGQVNTLSLSSISLVLSNLVSNVPAVLLLRPLVRSLADPMPGWLTLAASSTLAGNLTLLGSIANLIVAESASRRKVTIGFWEYTRAGILITFATMIISIIWIALVIW
ncbi:anion transporter [bacterium]|nr:anion transporter [bacterium]